MLAVLKSFYIGLRRRWKGAFVRAFGIVGAIWTVAEITIRSSAAADAWLDAHGELFLWIVGLGFALGFLIHIYEVRSVSFYVPTTDSRITIRFGDLFEAPTDWLVGVNEFFDGHVGQIVAAKSVHGQVIEKVFARDETRFRQEVDAALAQVVSTQSARTFEPKAKYPIGTTAIVMNGARRVFLMAMAHTDLTTHKATTSVPILWTAMKEALQSVADNGNADPLTMPLIGNGLANLNVEPQHLLRLIVLALVVFGRSVALPKEVTIVVPEGCFPFLDLREIRRDWSARHGL